MLKARPILLLWLGSCGAPAGVLLRGTISAPLDLQVAWQKVTDANEPHLNIIKT